MMLSTHAEKEKDTTRDDPEREGQSDPAPDHEESESHQNHEAGSREIELPLE